MTGFMSSIMGSPDWQYLKRGAMAAQQARARLARNGFTPWGDRLWTDDELMTCRSLFPDYSALQAALPSRSRRTIFERCRLLGLTQSDVKPWTAAEKTRLRRIFPEASWADICASFPDRTKGAIVRAAYKWGFRRKRQPYKKTSHEALDQVRQRCVEDSLFMPDLDEFTRSGNFFSRKAYRRKKPDLLAVDRAARVFGGRLRIEWADGE